MAQAVTAITGMRAVSAGAALCLAVSGGAACAGDSYADQGQVPVLSKIVRDTETGVRAEVRYFAEIPQGGQEEIVDADGTTQILHWDGWVGAFEVEVISGVDLADAGFVRGAVAAVCPSVDRAGLSKMTIGASLPGFYQFFLQCPDADARAAK